MAITLNRVGIEIDGQVYQLYKLSFGFQRKLIELQSNINKQTNEIAKKYSIDKAEVSTSELVTQEEKLAIAELSLTMQDALAELFVNPEEAKILDNFSGHNVTELINSLQ